MKFLFIFFFLIIFINAQNNEQTPKDNCEKKIGEVCVECIDNHFLVKKENPQTGIPTLECQSIEITNCTTYDNNICTKCDAGFTLSDNKCVSCPTNCLNCNVTHCHKCDEDYSLSSDLKQCLSDQSTDKEAFGICPTGKYYDKETRKCENCKDHCAICTSKNDCFQCKDRHYLSETGCLPLENCVTEKDDHCEKCASGYYLNEGKCEECSIDNCDIAFKNNGDDQGQFPCKCYQCREGFVKTADLKKCYSIKTQSAANDLNVEGNLKLESTDNEHCKKGHHLYGCLQCENGFYLDNTLVCKQCDQSCFNCTQETHCLACAENYYFESSDSNKCVPKASNCTSVDQFGCVVCNNEEAKKNPNVVGLYVPYGKQQCERCKNNCRFCHEDEKDSYNCDSCIPGYILSYSNGVVTCVPKPDDCTIAENGYCLECIEGYYLNSYAEYPFCKLCDAKCKTCIQPSSNDANAQTVCLECAEGYYWNKNHNNCLKQQDDKATSKPGCIVSGGGCQECKPGYTMNYTENERDRTCVKCDEACAECKFDAGKNTTLCTKCPSPQEYVKDGKCASCAELENCLECEGDKCMICKDGYKLDPGAKSCSKTQWGAIIPTTIVLCLIIIAVVIVIMVFLWWRRNKKIKAEEALEKTSKGAAEIEEICQNADNDGFPLSNDGWELKFGLNGSKAIVDSEYEELVTITNVNNKEHNFEIFAKKSTKYTLEISPKSAVLKPGHDIQVIFKLRMLCTTSINEEIPIVATNIDTQYKSTGKFTIIVESEPSIQLDYQELKPVMPPIGSGLNSIVLRGSYNGKDIAIKKLKVRTLTEEQKRVFDQEVNILTQSKNEFILEFIGAVYTPGSISIVTEFAEYGNLYRLWSKQNVVYPTKIKILKDVSKALKFLHESKFIHRNVKGENILIFSLNPNDICAKLSGFSQCKNTTEGKELTKGVGSVQYMAPELLNNEEYSFPIDVYAFGVVMYETFIERGAYDNDPRFSHPWNIPQFILSGERLIKNDQMPDNFWNIVEKCWVHTPNGRPTIDQVLNELESWGEVEDIELDRDKLTNKIIKKELPKLDDDSDEEEEPAGKSSSSSSSDD